MRSVFYIAIILNCTLLFANDDETLTLNEENSGLEQIQFIKSIPTTSVKDQNRTGTCWSFSGISLLETELIRAGKGEYDLSEMFVVRYNYERKAEKYVRMHGKMHFSSGGETNDVTDVINEFGIVPDSVYSGLRMNAEKHNHGELDHALEKYMSAIVTPPGKELSSEWEEEYDKVLNSYLGKIPDSFVYADKEYTSATFASSLGLDLNGYVMITSFIHHPFYEPVILEIPDNWSWAESYNVPLDVFELIVDTAIMKGYSVAWATDISEDGYNFKKGFALAPKILYASDSMREVKRWKKKTNAEKENYIFSLSEPVEELKVTPEIRQQAFENYSTTDDHGMQILGLAKDTNGRYFYYVKNSWGSENPFNGYLFVSKPYFQYKSICVMLNKEALTPEIRAKLNL